MTKSGLNGNSQDAAASIWRRRYGARPGVGFQAPDPVDACGPRVSPPRRVVPGGGGRAALRALVRTTRYIAGSFDGARAMTLCPVALAVGCKKCPIYTVCPVKGIIGDVPKASSTSEEKPKAKRRKN